MCVPSNKIGFASILSVTVHGEVLFGHLWCTVVDWDMYDTSQVCSSQCHVSSRVYTCHWTHSSPVPPRRTNLCKSLLRADCSIEHGTLQAAWLGKQYSHWPCGWQGEVRINDRLHELIVCFLQLALPIRGNQKQSARCNPLTTGGVYFNATEVYTIGCPAISNAPAGAPAASI